MLDLFLSELFIEIPLAQGTPVSLLRSFYRNPFSSGIPRRHSHIGIFHRNPSRSGSARQRLLVAFFSPPSLQLRNPALDLLSSELFIEIPLTQGAPANASLLRSFYRHPFGPGIPRSTFSYQYFSSKSLSLRKRRQPLLVAFFSPQSLRLRNPALDLLISELFIEIPFAQGTPANVSLLRSFHCHPFSSGNPRSTFSYRYFSSKSLSLRERPPTPPCCVLFTAIPSAQEYRARPSLISTFHRNPSRSGSAANLSLLRSFHRNPFGSGIPRSTFSYRYFSSKSLSLRERPLTSLCCALFIAIPSV